MNALKDKVQFILWFILYFFIFYIENFSLAGISIAQLWKIPLILLILYVLFKYHRLQKISFVGFILAFKSLFNFNYLIFTNVYIFSKNLIIPGLYNIISRFNLKPLKYLSLFSQFNLLSVFPFLFGVIVPPSSSDTLDLTAFGGADVNSFIGLFQKVHTASITLSASLIIVIALFKFYYWNSSFFFKFYLLCIILGGGYALYITYVRTGYLMFVVGFVILFFPRKVKFSQAFVFLLSIFLVFISFFYIIQENEVFRARLLDERKNSNNLYESAGSGRLVIWENSLRLFSESNLLEKVLGVGFDNLLDHQRATTGIRVFSHNQFIDSLVIDGLFGFSILVLFLFSIYKSIQEFVDPFFKRIALSLFISYLFFLFVQGGNYFSFELLLVLVLSLKSYKSGLIQNY